MMKNPILLSEWLSACARCDLAFIGAELGPEIPLDEFDAFREGKGLCPKMQTAFAWLEDHYQPGTTMWRWDCCATETLKSAVKSGARRVAPSLEFEADDPRLLQVLAELERRGDEGVRVVVRPWVEAKIEAGFAVEFRVFVDGPRAAVTNYHARRPLPRTYASQAREALSLARRLARVVAPDLDAFSADFLLASSGQLFFLEGGLPFDGGRLVDSCCFLERPDDGAIALARPARA